MNSLVGIVHVPVVVGHVIDEMRFPFATKLFVPDLEVTIIIDARRHLKPFNAHCTTWFEIGIIPFDPFIFNSYRELLFYLSQTRWNSLFQSAARDSAAN